MNMMTTENLRNLLQHNHGPCVSMYMPTQGIYPGQQQDQTRFENLVRRGTELLISHGISSTEAEALMKPTHEMLDETEFWRHQDHGLAHFVARDFRQTFRISFSPEELVMVGDRFHLKPLLRLLVGDGRFYVLAVSRNNVRLLQGTKHEVSAVDLETVPPSLAEALKFDDPEQQYRYHTSGSAAGGRPQAIFHGQGIGVDDAKENLLRYFRAIDRGLHEFLRDKRDPLIFAGVEYYFPIYREANTYPYLMEDAITGSPDYVTNEQLLESAWKIVEPWFWREEEQEAERYRRWAGTGLTASDLSTIIPAAIQGRVESLILAMNQPQWGCVDSAKQKVEVHDRAQPGDEDLVDCAAIETLLHGGRVFVVDPEKVPESNHLAAAVLRY
jgi:hypothetical protein